MFILAGQPLRPSEIRRYKAPMYGAFHANVQNVPTLGIHKVGNSYVRDISDYYNPKTLNMYVKPAHEMHLYAVFNAAEATDSRVFLYSTPNITLHKTIVGPWPDNDFHGEWGLNSPKVIVRYTTTKPGWFGIGFGVIADDSIAHFVPLDLNDDLGPANNGLGTAWGYTYGIPFENDSVTIDVVSDMANPRLQQTFSHIMTPSVNVSGVNYSYRVRPGSENNVRVSGVNSLSGALSIRPLNMGVFSLEYEVRNGTALVETRILTGAILSDTGREYTAAMAEDIGDISEDFSPGDDRIAISCLPCGVGGNCPDGYFCNDVGCCEGIP
jgi:hypothetical protein